MQGSEFFTYIIDGKAVTRPFDEDLAKKYAYSKSKLMGADKKLFVIAWDVLPHNDQKRMEQSMLATGCFIVQQCKLFTNVYSELIEDYGVRLVNHEQII